MMAADKTPPFGDRLSALCAMELSGAHGDAERIGEMIERLLNSLAFTVAIATRGDPKAIDDMLTGASAYLYDTAAGHAKLGGLFEALKRSGR